VSFRINRVYTRSGDKGETSLVDGTRVLKNHLRCEIFGTLDEVNSCLGLAKSCLDSEKEKQLFDVIEYIQQELFDLGAEMATPVGYSYPSMWKAGKVHIEHLEKLCDHFNKDLPELDSFILPGGNMLASHLHLARTVTRRAERSMVALLQSEKGSISDEALIYCNRLSDLLFVLSRYVLHTKGVSAPLWKQEKDRISPIAS
jgi:cob(I)alamin adenosyltransferase